MTAAEAFDCGRWVDPGNGRWFMWVPVYRIVGQVPPFRRISLFGWTPTLRGRWL